MSAMSDIKDFGTKLRLLRGEISQTEFAARLGLTRAAVANYELGRSHPSGDQASRILLLAAGGTDVTDKLRHQTAGDDDQFERQLREMFKRHDVQTFSQLAEKMGLSRSAVGNWVNRRSIPERYLRLKPARQAQPWQLLAALSVLRDDALTDAEARKSAETFLKQLEVAHV